MTILHKILRCDFIYQPEHRFCDIFTVRIALYLGSKHHVHRVRKRVVPAGLGTFPTTGPVWVSLLVGVILIVGALTYFPALSLGPIVEQLLLAAGKTFS